MESHILEALPGIHGILIGIGVAFFSAFAMYAYQKLQETKDQLDKIILEVEAFSTPSNYIGGSQTKLINDEGELDWDGEAKQLIHHAKSIYSYLDYEEKYGIPRDAHTRIPDNDDVLETCKDMCLIFHYLFVTYPFSGNSMVHVAGVSDKINTKKSLPFNMPRLLEIERRISFLSWCWETSNRSIITLGQQSNLIEKRKLEEQAKASFNESIARTPDMSENEKKRIWETFHQPRISHQIDYNQIITEYFNKVFMYRDNVLPKLKEMIKTHETFNGRFHVKSTTLYALKFFAFIFLV